LERVNLENNLVQVREHAEKAGKSHALSLAEESKEVVE
jgi:hypothetical protein